MCQEKCLVPQSQLKMVGFDGCKGVNRSSTIETREQIEIRDTNGLEGNVIN